LTVRSTGRLWLQRPVLGWALYDWANSAFSLTVMTSFVPVMLAGLWSDGAPSSVGTFRLGLANGIASLVVALLAPILGTLADRSGRRKAWLLWITFLGVVLTASLGLAAAGQWLLALALYALASIAFATGNALYDSLLVDVAASEDYDRVSALGYALGYLGGALLLAFNVAMVARPAAFGLASSNEALQWAFPLVAVWWLVFSLPLALWVRDDPAAEGGPGALAGGFRQLAATLAAAREHTGVVAFLLGYWLYIDGVYTIIKMAVDYGLSLGLSAQDLIGAILLTNFVAFPAAIGFGALAGRIGARNGIYLGLGVYILCSVAAVFIDSTAEFYALAVAIGLVQGGVQSLSRSFFARLIPAAQTAEYFGFYNMVGKFAAIIGPVLTGTVALFTGSQRAGIFSLLVLFLAGIWLLRRVPEPERHAPVLSGKSSVDRSA
jgi:MFS transporter, UMF1 family